MMLRPCGVSLAVAALIACGGSDSPSFDAAANDIDGNAAQIDGGDSCGCQSAPFADRIWVISQNAELYTWSPQTGEFEFHAALSCAGGSRAYSMAIDSDGIAWILFAETQRVYTVDLANPTQCVESPYRPNQADFDLFGMAFAGGQTDGECPELHVHSYSGSGPFDEGPDVGSFGTIDPFTGDLTIVSPLDYDGGELGGTGDDRIMSLAGVDPAKLIEIVPETGAILQVLPLDGVSKTTASALALYGGDAYLFTEQQPAGCDTCMTAACGASFTNCLADETCAEDFRCVVETTVFSDECGGLLPGDVQTCLIDDCTDDCLVALSERVSQVTLLDLDDSEGMGLNPTIVGDTAPVRIAGASNSPCVPYVP
jgi:hypothetical protein